jgi:hypothetical protein
MGPEGPRSRLGRHRPEPPRRPTTKEPRHCLVAPRRHVAWEDTSPPEPRRPGSTTTYRGETPRLPFTCAGKSSAAGTARALPGGLRRRRWRGGAAAGALGYVALLSPAGSDAGGKPFSLKFNPNMFSTFTPFTRNKYISLILPLIRALLVPNMRCRK